MTMTSARVSYLYDLMDAAYAAAAIHDQSRALGHVPIVDRNFRADHQAKAECGREVERLKLIHMPDFDDLIYDFRTMAERVNARLKDEFGADFSASAAHSRSNAISCSASSRSPSIRSSVSSTTGPPPPDPAGFTPARRRKIHLAQAFCKKLLGFGYSRAGGAGNNKLFAFSIRPGAH